MPHNSPNVLIPLVEAIEFCCKQHETVRQSIAAAISKIHFGLIPGQNLVGTLNLHQAIELPVVPPSAVGMLVPWVPCLIGCILTSPFVTILGAVV